MNKNIKQGIIFSLITAIISGFSIFYNKLVITKGIDPLIFNIIKNGGVAVILSVILLSKPKSLLKKQFNKLKYLILIGLVGGSIPFYLFFAGLRMADAVNANLIHKTLFIWVAFLAIPFLGEKLQYRQILGYILIFSSNLFLGGFSGFKFNSGELMILTATLLWSIENIIAKLVLKKTDSNLVAWGRMFFGCLFLLALAIYNGKISLLTKINITDTLPIFTSVILLTTYIVSWYKALKLAPATLVTSILILATPITNILTAVFITHSLLPIQIYNGLFSILGVIIVSFFMPKLFGQNALSTQKTKSH